MLPRPKHTLHDMTRMAAAYAVTLILVLAAVHTAGAAQSPVRVVVEGGREYYGDIVRQAAGRNFDRIARTLGYVPEQPITIILARDDDRFKELTRGVLPDWSAAAALDGSTIVVAPLEGHSLSLERIIAHEIVHCIIMDAAGGTPVPRWFHEGCAEYLSGGLGLRDRLYVVWNVVRGRVLSFDEIERIFGAPEADAGLAYDQSLIAVRLLAGRGGPDAIAGIIGRIREGMSFREALEATTGMTAGSFEIAFRDHLRRRYGRRSLMYYIPGTWTLILILAFLAYAAKKISTRRKLRQWEEEEGGGSVVRFPDTPPDDWM